MGPVVLWECWACATWCATVGRYCNGHKQQATNKSSHGGGGIVLFGCLAFFGASGSVNVGHHVQHVGSTGVCPALQAGGKAACKAFFGGSQTLDACMKKNV